MEAIRKATLNLKIVPVLCGAALRGIKAFSPCSMRSFIICPRPEDVPPVKGHHPVTGEEESRLSSEKEPLAALAFKVMMDEGRKLTFLRIYAGRIQVNEDLYNVIKKKKEKLSPYI